jgi:Na+-translocating ferredoxin:NAD+ oxidoreductase RnfG subunit
MRSDTKAKLDSALRLQWLKRGAMALGFLAVMAGGLWYTGLDASVTNQRVKAVVDEVLPAAGMSTQVVENAVVAWVKIEGGQRVQVIVLKANEPKVGDQIEITQHVHGTGRVTYSWK